MEIPKNCIHDSSEEKRIQKSKENCIQNKRKYRTSGLPRPRRFVCHNCGDWRHGNRVYERKGSGFTPIGWRCHTCSFVKLDS